ncbi:hypothetical protein AwErysi_04180 [Erysipelotrichaceae bacterium]|nr:hypothetical protein AwErysi_04180 [Erysipelotrichaceae bacterium]
MNALREKINHNYPTLTDTNKLISDVIRKKQPFTLKIRELSELAYCSNSAIMKYIHYFGYASYKVFLTDLNQQQEQPFYTYMKSFQIVNDYLYQNQELISTFILNIKHSKNVYLFAAGQSQISAIDFMQKANKKEPGKFVFESNMETQKLLLSTISENDFIIFISNSGEARELIYFKSQIGSSHITLITNRKSSTLAKIIPHVLSLGNNFESAITFKEFSRESKYTLLYFFDLIFEMLYIHKITPIEDKN